MNDILKKYKAVRERTLQICNPLETEDHVVQPVGNVSPPKWHMGHTTWFFETFVLKPHQKDYKVFDSNYNFLFNSYYESVGAHLVRTNRGNLSRPTVEEIREYRQYVDHAMGGFMNDSLSKELSSLIILGLNHEEQHQELLLTDIKYILGHNPLFPPYDRDRSTASKEAKEGDSYVSIKEGLYEIGFEGSGFCYDNETSRHKAYLQDYEISRSLVTNGEYLKFIEAGGYRDFQYWHSDGWIWVQEQKIAAPLYWHKVNEQWMHYTWQGLIPLDSELPLAHISYYEAAAFAAWKGMRLPTEAEWEVAEPQLDWGKRWEWTESAYLPYPGFKKAPGAIGEYNGKFMVNQKVLRGASEATSPGHSRSTYRNFFQPDLRWQFTGIRLAK